MQDNKPFRTLFSLPPIQFSATTALTVPELPPQSVVTGDEELDAVLWLREVIKTGQQALIDKAMEAFKRIKTPPKELEKRYTAYVSRASNGHFAAIMMTFGFADLEKLAQSSITKTARQHEALARFGSVENLFKKTPAELACEKALRGLKRDKTWDNYEATDEVDARFAKHTELVPHTLTDCLYAQANANALYRLRHASADDAGDHWPAFQAHDYYCFRSQARIAPLSKEEALAVFAFMEEEGQMNHKGSKDILRNLIAGGWGLNRTCLHER